MRNLTPQGWMEPRKIHVIAIASRNRVSNSIFLSPCTGEEVEKIIHNFENDKASDISVTILKKCATVISEHLSGFFNMFMESGTFPKILKIGKITPIFKKGDSQIFDNYIGQYQCYQYLEKSLKN